jgi:DNA-binding CsgD family transcriptional regulator
MLPRVKLEAVGHGIDAALAPALTVAQTFDSARPAEVVLGCMRLADLVQVIDLAATDPLGWAFAAKVGIERLNGATSPAATCFGEMEDQGFARDVLLPTYWEAIAADQPVVHRVAAVNNSVFLSYRRLTVPLYAAPRAGQASHFLTLTQIDLALPQIRSRGEVGSALTFRERQCLSLAASGRGAKQTAAELGVSEKTVELHLARARHKLGAQTTTQAVAIALVMALNGSLPAREPNGSPTRSDRREAGPTVLRRDGRDQAYQETGGQAALLERAVKARLRCAVR